MPNLELSLEQVIEIVEKLQPEERAELHRRLNASPKPESQEQWHARHQELRTRLGKSPRPLADDIIADREDRLQLAAYYVESSAFAKLFHDEPGTGRMQTLLAAREHGFHVTPICIVEVHSSVARRVRAGELGPMELDALTACITQDLQEGLYRLLPMYGGFYTRAIATVKSVGTTVALRSLDALHLAAALELRDQTPDVVLVSSDARLRAAAAEAGMPALDPTRAQRVRHGSYLPPVSEREPAVWAWRATGAPAVEVGVQVSAAGEDGDPGAKRRSPCCAGGPRGLAWPPCAPSSATRKSSGASPWSRGRG